MESMQFSSHGGDCGFPPGEKVLFPPHFFMQGENQPSLNSNSSADGLRTVPKVQGTLRSEMIRINHESISVRLVNFGPENLVCSISLQASSLKTVIESRSEAGREKIRKMVSAFTFNNNM